MDQKVTLEIKTPRTGEETPEAMMQFLASFSSLKNDTPISLEIAAFDSTIHFYLVAPPGYQSYIESQLLSQYPKALVTEIKDNPFTNLSADQSDIQTGQVKLQHNFLYPLKSFRDFKDVDPLSSLVGMLTRLSKDDVALVQFLLVPTSPKWQAKGQRMMEQKGAKEEGALTPADPFMISTYSKQISDKVSYPGFKVAIRILTRGRNSTLIELIAATFISCNDVTGNSLSLVGLFFGNAKNSSGRF